MTKPRGPRLVRSAKRAPANRRASTRARLASALERCAARERDLLALLLVERLTPAEAAEALGISTRSLHRAFAAVMAELEAALRTGATGGARRARMRSSVTAEYLRRAS